MSEEERDSLEKLDRAVAKHCQPNESTMQVVRIDDGTPCDCCLTATDIVMISLDGARRLVWLCREHRRKLAAILRAFP